MFDPFSEPSQKCFPTVCINWPFADLCVGLRHGTEADHVFV